MSNVRIVTDSTAHFFDPAFPAQHHVVVVPLTIHIGKQSFRDGADITTEQVLRYASNGGPLPTAASPAAAVFTSVYEDLVRQHDKIVSIHISGKLSRTARNARLGSEALLGRSKIEVIDSLTTSLGLGLLVEAAARAAERGASIEDIVRIVRAMIPRVYSVFFIETLQFLAQAGRISKAQATLGAMLGIKPFLTMEEGDIVPMEKVRTRQQAVEKLLEFIIEFSDVEHVAILQSTQAYTEDTRMLLDQLALEFPARHWPVLAYGPSLATFLGPNAMGVVIYEGDLEPE